MLSIPAKQEPFSHSLLGECREDEEDDEDDNEDDDEDDEEEDKEEDKEEDEEEEEEKEKKKQLCISQGRLLRPTPIHAKSEASF